MVPILPKIAPPKCLYSLFKHVQLHTIIHILFQQDKLYSATMPNLAMFVGALFVLAAQKSSWLSAVLAVPHTTSPKTLPKYHISPKYYNSTIGRLILPTS